VHEYIARKFPSAKTVVFMKSKSRKVMVVGSEFGEKLERHLVLEGWVIHRVRDAKTALASVRRERLDLVILISTGEEMDFIETFFNLKDIRRSLPVIVVRQSGDGESAAEGEFSILPNAGLRSVQGFDGLVRFLNAERMRSNAVHDRVVRSHGRDGP
jgi:hypothetical protein